MNAHLAPSSWPSFLRRRNADTGAPGVSVLVDNEPGILARIVGLFAARGFNIDSSRSQRPSTRRG